MDEQLRSFIALCLEEDPSKRATIGELLEQPFLEKSETDHEYLRISDDLYKLIYKYYPQKHPGHHSEHSAPDITNVPYLNSKSKKQT